MGILELFILAVGLSMDAFAVAVCVGLSLEKITYRRALIVGLYFGGFQALMPLIGYVAGSLFADKIITYDHWIAFGLLSFLGIKMIIGSLKSSNEVPTIKNQTPDEVTETCLKPKAMLPLAVATSIDALAVGISLAFLNVKIIPAVSFIGITTLVLSMIGVKIGNVFGLKFKSKAEFAGGVILILIGLNILLDHLEIFYLDPLR